MADKDEQERLERVSYLLRKGYTQTEIGLEIDRSRSQVVRYVRKLKRLSRAFLSDLEKDGLVFEFQLALDKIKDHERKLHQLLEQAKSVKEQRQILKTLDENAALYIKLLAEAPTVLAYKKAMSLDSKDTKRPPPG